MEPCCRFCGCHFPGVRVVGQGPPEQLLNKAGVRGARGTHVWPGCGGAPGSFGYGLQARAPSCLGQAWRHCDLSACVQAALLLPVLWPGVGGQSPWLPAGLGAGRVLAQPGLGSLGFRTTGCSPAEEQENSTCREELDSPRSCGSGFCPVLSGLGKAGCDRRERGTPSPQGSLTAPPRLADWAGWGCPPLGASP